MRFEWNKKYATISFYAFLVLLAAMLFYLGISNFSNVNNMLSTFITIIKPFIIGFSLAYLLNFILTFIERKLFDKLIKKKMPFKLKRAISMLLTYVSVGLTITLFMKFVLPQVTQSIVGIASDFPRIVERIYDYTDALISNIDLSHTNKQIINKKVTELGKDAMDFATNLVPYFGNAFVGLVLGVWNLLLGIIVSIYILADKEGFSALCKKFIAAVFSQEKGQRILYVTDLSNDIFGKFLVGKIIDSCIIAFITFIILKLTGMPYPILLTFIIGVTNIIPFFGPFIGAVPSILLVLFIDPIKALWLTLIIFLIQQLDGNVIGPKILGDSIGISSFWILFSLLIAGKFFGIVGMIIGVPVFSIIYTIVADSLNNKLKKKGLPVSKEYYNNNDC
ncbi:AI-2E family transporter [Peptostreptococcus equinus]|uniref:AI-2E family transporter n=1 Tax=Peptostreptococcus equinus TaxID=3003601 RepID=A0ABY7JQN8_9FIRM|nr:AI-2E family transporter [Peptostreptococcus sp. CBA3647]WAW15670.1 AI-2E family transporter [Peptostreptococcus sp. CBA3647]